MAAGLHSSARTTQRVRAELQAAQTSSRALAARIGLNPKTVRKWRGRTGTADAPWGPNLERPVDTHALDRLLRAMHGGRVLVATARDGQRVAWSRAPCQWPVPPLLEDDLVALAIPASHADRSARKAGHSATAVPAVATPMTAPAELAIQSARAGLRPGERFCSNSSTAA
jgi:hypothetical protein